jgi:hypothetical protein
MVIWKAYVCRQRERQKQRERVARERDRETERERERERERQREKGRHVKRTRRHTLKVWSMVNGYSKQINSTRM